MAGRNPSDGALYAVAVDSNGVVQTAGGGGGTSLIPGQDYATPAALAAVATTANAANAASNAAATAATNAAASAAAASAAAAAALPVTGGTLTGPISGPGFIDTSTLNGLIDLMFRGTAAVGPAAHTVRIGVVGDITNPWELLLSDFVGGNAPQVLRGIPGTRTDSSGAVVKTLTVTPVTPGVPFTTTLVPSGASNPTFTPQPDTSYFRVRGACAGTGGQGSGTRDTTQDPGSVDNCSFDTYVFKAGYPESAHNLDPSFGGGKTDGGDTWSTAGAPGEGVQIVQDAYINGGNGGPSCLGGVGRGHSALAGDAASDPARQAQPGQDGGGGGGGATKGTGYAGSGGGAGACINLLYTVIAKDSNGNPKPIPYTLSYGGTAGGPGTGGFPGARGGDAKLVIEEFKQ